MKSSTLPKLSPVTILIVSFNRKKILEKCIQSINDRTFYPFRIIVLDNASIDGSQNMLKEMKVQGKIFDCIFLPKNIGQSQALNIGFDEIEKWEIGVDRPIRPSSDFFVTTCEDVYPPMLGQENCWLQQMINILGRNEPEFGGICMRFQRLARTDIDENKEITECFKGFNSNFRLMRRSDIRKLGDEPFGRLLKWNSNSTADKYKLQLKKKFGFTNGIYASHVGFVHNSGYDENINTFTVAANKIDIAKEKPYPDIDPLTNEPVKINHPCDLTEQNKRDEYRKIINGERVGAEVTILILTYKRLNSLIRLLDSIKKTADIPYELLVMIDNDDTESYDYCLEHGLRCILANWHRDFVAQVNMGIYACETPYIAKFDDDQEVVSPDWLSRGLRVYKEMFPDNDGLMCFNDGLCHGAVWTAGIVSKKFVNFIGGHLIYPKYKHFGGDRELVGLAKKIGYYHYEESIKVNHYHPDNKNPELVNEKDETYKLSQNKFWRHDQDLKHNRAKNVDILKEKNYCDYL